MRAVGLPHRLLPTMQLQPGSRFRGCGHSLMFRPLHSPSLPAVHLPQDRRSRAARPHTPRRTRLVTCPEQWHGPSRRRSQQTHPLQQRPGLESVPGSASRVGGGEAFAAKRRTEHAGCASPRRSVPWPSEARFPVPEPPRSVRGSHRRGWWACEAGNTGCQPEARRLTAG